MNVWIYLAKAKCQAGRAPGQATDWAKAMAMAKGKAMTNAMGLSKARGRGHGNLTRCTQDSRYKAIYVNSAVRVIHAKAR